MSTTRVNLNVTVRDSKGEVIAGFVKPPANPTDFERRLLNPKPYPHAHSLQHTREDIIGLFQGLALFLFVGLAIGLGWGFIAELFKRF